MKKLFLFVVPLFLFGLAKSQPITDTATLRSYINAEIVTNGTKAITAPKVNRILNGFLNVWPNMNNYVPTSRIITINGISHNLATDPSWSISTGGGGIDTSNTIEVNLDSIRMAYLAQYKPDDSTVVFVRINGETDTLHLSVGTAGGLTKTEDIRDTFYLEQLGDTSVVFHQPSINKHDTLTGFFSVGGESVSSSHFGIEDNTGVQDRSMNMRTHNLVIDSLGTFNVKAQASGNVSDVYMSGGNNDIQSYDDAGTKYSDVFVSPANAFLSVQDYTTGTTAHKIEVNKENVFIQSSVSSIESPPKFVIRRVNEGSDTVTTPTRVAVWDGDTLKSAAISVFGGGSTTRFGIEDDSSYQNRIIDFQNTYGLTLQGVQPFRILTGDYNMYTNKTSFFSVDSGAVLITTDNVNATLHSGLSMTENNAYLTHNDGPNGGSFFVDSTGPALVKQHKISPLVNSYSRLTVPDLGVVNLVEVSRVIPVSVNGNYADNVGNIISTPYASTSTDYTPTGQDYSVNVTATGQTITLPTAVGRTGKVYVIKLTASGTGTVATTSSQTIDGSTTYSLTAQYKYVTVQSTGANWIIIANN